MNVIDILVALIALPIALSITFLTGLVIRHAVFKDKVNDSNTVNFFKNVGIGIVFIAIFGTVFKGCNHSSNDPFDSINSPRNQ